MKPTARVLALLMSALMPSSAQQINNQVQHAQSRRAGGPPHKTQATITPACKDLKGLGTVLDDAENKGKIDHILAAIEGVEKYFGNIRADDRDLIWDELTDCANQNPSESERAEALRVLAIWEHWRAATFQTAYRNALPTNAATCKDLDRFDLEVKANLPNSTEMRSYKFPDNLSQIEIPLAECAAESAKLNQGKPVSQFARAYQDLWELRTSWELSEENLASVPTGTAGEHHWRTELADPSALVVFRPEDRVPSDALPKASEHNRNLCDQIVTVAGLTPKGLALYVPPEGQRFMVKNAKNYPRMCLLQDTTSFVPGVPRYLLAWTYSENAFTGFQAVERADTTPVSGSASLTNSFGDKWNFTYSGTLTEIDTIEAPYVIKSRSLYLYAYDEEGNVVSQHSITASSQARGDASYAAGYNAGALISLLWNNPSHLIKGVLKDVQKDSMKYGKK